MRPQRVGAKNLHLPGDAVLAHAGFIHHPEGKSEESQSGGAAGSAPPAPVPAAARGGQGKRLSPEKEVKSDDFPAMLLGFC